MARADAMQVGRQPATPARSAPEPAGYTEAEMGLVIALLRGVNVGGHNKIKMDALRALCASLKLRDPQTYIQSGNVVFRTEERDLARLSKRIEDGIERSFGFRPDVIVRTMSEMKDVVARNAFATRRGIDPSKLLVTFLTSDPGPEARDEVRKIKIKTDPEELWIDGRELYIYYPNIYYPNGMGRSKLSWAVVEKTLKTRGTGRNWNSVRKLLEMAESLEAWNDRRRRSRARAPAPRFFWYLW